jgi:hypothetical protein
MEILERDGRYFLQLSNGELELTEEQVKARLQKGAVIRNNLQSWIDNFSYRHWIANNVPSESDSFISSTNFFDDIIHEFEQIYQSSGNKNNTAERMLEFCWGKVQSLKREKEHATTDKQKIFLDFHTLCWLRVVSFVQALSHIYTPLF